MKAEQRHKGVRRNLKRRVVKAGEADAEGVICPLCTFMIQAGEDIVYHPEGDLAKIADRTRPMYHSDCLGEASRINDIDPRPKFERIRNAMLEKIA